MCPLCGINITFSSETELVNLRSTYSQGQEYSLRECRCGTLLTIPQPSAQLLQSIYTRSYAYRYHVLLGWEKRFRARDLLSKLAPMDLTVCDLGCGDGSLLMEAERMGYRTSGCEQDNFSVKIANSRLIGGVESTTVSNYLQHIKSLPSLVVMSHSLEHLLDPGETLRRIYSLMPSGGILVLALPNADQGRKSRIKTYWGYWQVPVHVTHFGAKEFPKYLSRLGFRVESMRLRSFDFLTLGSTVLNFLKINSGDLGANTSLVSRIVLPFAGFVWRSGLKFGSSEMVIEVRKR